MEKLSPSVLQRFQVLKQIQSELDDLEAKHFEDRKKLENEYQTKFQPLYTKRYEIVNGVPKVLKSTNGPANQGENKPAEEIGVPNFWLTVMKSNEFVAEMIQKHDEDALRYLKDIKWHRIELSKDKYPQAKATGFKFEFFFDRNPYFKNPVLSKTYCILDEDNDLLLKTIGTEIRWFPRKCLTNIVLSRSRRPSGGTIVTVLDSFFNFFNCLEMLDVDVDDIDEMIESVTSLIKQDYNAGLNLKEDIIPHAVYGFIDGNSDNESGVNIVDITNSHKNAKAKKLPHTVQLNVKLLEKIQIKHDELEDMFFEARRALEDKYLELYQPLFRKRYEIVNGCVEVSDFSIEPATDETEDKSAQEKGVPNFWLTALKAREIVGKLIQKQDEEVLKCLKDISWRKVRHPDDAYCVELEFYFGENPYFRNLVLTKSYFIDEDYPFTSVDDIVWTKIDWFDRKQLNGSFFDFFTLPKLPDYEDSDLTDEEWRSLMHPDYNVGSLICNDVIPHAVSLFTGEFEDCIEDDR